MSRQQQILAFLIFSIFYAYGANIKAEELLKLHSVVLLSVTFSLLLLKKLTIKQKISYLWETGSISTDRLTLSSPINVNILIK